MSTRKKRHLIAGTIIGGLLLAATTQTGNSFALSDTSSTSGNNSTATSQQTPSSTSGTPTSATTTGTPTNTPSNTANTGTDSVAGGSTATQTANTSSGASTTTGTTGSDPSSNSTQSTTPTTDGQQTTTTQTNSDPTNTSLSNDNDTTVKNDIKSTAKTGAATVKDTLDGGDATTGNASAIATLINSLASSSDLSGSSIPTATFNVNGTQNGNIVIDPESILALANSVNSSSPVVCTPGTTTADNSATINNLVNLLAQSGNAKVTDNGVGGNATSGNATTEADIVNLIQDLVSNKGAFLGVVNINGNLNGNIDLPASDISSLLTPTASGGTASANSTAVNNANINNGVTLTAISGNAAVTNNGVGGNATSGNAQTILNTNNLINCQIVGGNLLLVFVNVMGHWYGALLSEPAGQTTATLGGGITQDTLLPTSETSAFNNSMINNNVHLTSISGNATVANNGVGGNATTGDATAIADISNIIGSQINLSGWLGILIINVYGTWNGSVGILPQTSNTNTSDQSISGSNSPDLHNPVVSASTHHTLPDGDSAYFIIDPPQSFDAGQFDLASAHMLSANTQLPNNDLGSSIRQAAAVTNHDTQPTKHLLANFILAGIGLALALTGGITRVLASRRSND